LGSGINSMGTSVGSLETSFTLDGKSEALSSGPTSCGNIRLMRAIYLGVSPIRTHLQVRMVVACTVAADHSLQRRIMSAITGVVHIYMPKLSSYCPT
jgi:hypothetical protein